jgi:hypothetical protein
MIWFRMYDKPVCRQEMGKATMIQRVIFDPSYLKNYIYVIKTNR